MSIKVRAHADKTKAAFLQQAPHHTFGNMVADTLAGLGAAYLEGTIGFRSNEMRDTDRDAALVLQDRQRIEQALDVVRGLG